MVKYLRASGNGKTVFLFFFSSLYCFLRGIKKYIIKKLQIKLKLKWVSFVLYLFHHQQAELQISVERLSKIPGDDFIGMQILVGYAGVILSSTLLKKKSEEQIIRIILLKQNDLYVRVILKFFQQILAAISNFSSLLGRWNSRTWEWIRTVFQEKEMKAHFFSFEKNGYQSRKC